MKKKKVLTGGLILTVIAVIIASIAYNAIQTSNSQLSSEEKRAMTYNEIDDDDAKIDNCDYVQFSSFFTRDLDGNRICRKI